MPMPSSKEPISVKLSHYEALKFSAEVGERSVQLNSNEEMGEAFTPMELFLVALAGCTAMDVQFIVERQRQKMDRFEVTISGTRRDQDPRYFESIEIRYSLAGTGLRRDAVERAIRLSQEKYCSVRAMVKDTVKLNVTYAITDGTEPEELYTYVPSPG